MKIVVYTEGWNIEHIHANICWPLLFSEGLKKHGVKHDIKLNKDAEECDLAILWSQAGKSIEPLKLAKEYLLIERGYLGDRTKWSSLAYNGLNGRGDFNLKKEMPSDRWDRHHSHLMKPWNPLGNYILIIGQMKYDASLWNVDYIKWLHQTTQYYDSRKIKFIYREHPGAKIYDDNFNQVSNLDYQIKNAKSVITCNSTTGVVSLLGGKSTIAMDEGSMAYSIAYHERSDWHKIQEISRKQWAYNLAYCQWTKEEFADGTAWKTLNKYEN